MNWPKHLATAAVLGISLFLIFSQTLYASVDTARLGQSAQAYYIDPGTGSIIIQVLIGSFVAGPGHGWRLQNEGEEFLHQFIHRAKTQ
jgi:hypothetical protein